MAETSTENIAGPAGNGPRWGWRGFADSETGVMLGPGWIMAAAVFAWTPVLAGPAGFTAAAEFAGIPLAIVLGFFVQERGKLASELLDRSRHAEDRRQWQVLLGFTGSTAIGALLALVAYVAAVNASEGAETGVVARTLAAVVAVLVVFAIGTAARLPHLVRRLEDVSAPFDQDPRDARWRGPVAELIDGVAMAGLFVLLGLALLSGGWTSESATMAWLLGAAIVSVLGYEWIAGVVGHTIGMRFLKLRIEDAPCDVRWGRVARSGLRATIVLAQALLVGSGVWAINSGLASSGDAALWAALVLSWCLLGAFLTNARGQGIPDVVGGMIVRKRQQVTDDEAGQTVEGCAASD